MIRLALLLILLAASADAMIIQGGGSPPISGCTNSRLDFSNSCNAFYFGTVMR